jgi:hypothetical protein
MRSGISSVMVARAQKSPSDDSMTRIQRRINRAFQDAQMSPGFTL